MQLKAVLSRQVGRWSIVLTVVADVARVCAATCTGRRSG